MDLQQLLKKYKLPEQVLVEITRNADGTFFAKLPDYAGCLTVADNPLELIQNVTDAILTYFEIPRKQAVECNITYMPPLPKLSELEMLINRRRGIPLSTQLQAQFLYFTGPRTPYEKYSRIR